VEYGDSDCEEENSEASATLLVEFKKSWKRSSLLASICETQIRRGIQLLPQTYDAVMLQFINITTYHHE